MVLYKRKPITPSNAPTNIRSEAEVWVMKVTGEAFTSYEHYLQRLDYYNQKNFTCEITGHTNLTYFEALKSETHGSAQVDNTFPEQLREPILRKVQFSTTPRIDELVNLLYDQFKEDFFPGEKVTVLLGNDQSEFVANPRMEGVVKDKINYPERRRPDGTIEREATSRYFVALKGNSHEALADSTHVFRDRRSFTKNVLRSFLKNSVSRERWDGAPWIVKENLARAYNIDTTTPTKLLYDNVVAERKAMASLRKGRPDEQCLQYFASQGELPQLAEASKIHRGKLPKHLVTQFEASLVSGKPINLKAFAADFVPEGEAGPPMPRQRPPQPAVVKYPIDDLELHPKAKVEPRPGVKLFQDTATSYSQDAHIDGSTVGTLLSIWNTFNIHTSLYKVDSFTYDDFVDAMMYNSTEVECELLNELHCSAMKLLVDEAGVVDSYIPQANEDQEDDDDSSVDNSAVSTPAPEESRRVSARSRTSLLKNDITQTLKGNSPKRNANSHHRVEEMLGDTDWQSRLMIRDFTNGGWQVILAGILLHMSTILVKEKEACDKILAHLAPLDQKPTKETARRQYATLDANLRAVALDIVVMLTITSKAMKDSMERRQEQMTEDRKEKVQRQRDRKVLAEDLHNLDDQRKTLFPNETPPPVEEAAADAIKSEDPETKVEANEDEDNDTDMGDSDDDISARRRISGRANDLKRKREEDDARREKDKQARLEAKASQSAQKKILRDIELKKKALRKCEEEIIEYEERLRVNSCHRTRVLGRDRFWNRYYWFERNGMPLAGQSTSSTAAVNYANGRIWVQGPDDLERAGFIDLADADQAQYRAAFGVTVPQRRDLEEGPSQLRTAYDWGYYDTPASLDALLSWFDDRGNRERALKKEINAWRDRIVDSMDAMHAHLENVERRRTEDPEPVVGIATRKKTHGGEAAREASSRMFPCLAWRNDTARRELGMLHCEGKLVVEERKARRGAREVVKEVSEEPVVTRRGTRYR